MNKKIVSIIIFVSLFCITGLALAQSGSVTLPNPLDSNTFGDLLKKIALGVGALVATLGTIMIIVAGILYLTSAGNPQKIETAKKALIYAIAGIAIGLAAAAIVEIITGILGTK